MKIVKLVFGTNNFTMRILIAMLIGLLVGVAFHQLPTESQIYTLFVGGVFQVIGKIFVASLKMLVVPLVFVSLVTGVASLHDINKLGRIGIKTLGLYLFTTFLAIAVALGLSALIQPGAGFTLNTEGAAFVAKESPGFATVLSNIVPSNPIKSAANGEMLQIIVFAILFGIGIVLCGEKAKKLSQVFTELNGVILKMVTVLMGFAPLGVAALLAKVFAQQGIDVFIPLLRYLLLTLAVLFLHMFITYPLILKFVGGLNPITFIKKIKEVVLIAFSTASSNATIPVTMKTVTEKLGVKSSLASFTVPLGATINMDGTAIMQGVATVFISQVYGIELSITSYLLVIATATLASIGTAGVPGVGLVTLAMVLKQAGLPVEGIGLILGVDRILDMVRTATNVVGDATVTCVVGKLEKQLDKETFNKELS